MSQKKKILFPKTISILERFGENIRLARLRRNLTSSLQAERAGISRPTLTMIEKGSPSVSLGNYPIYSVFICCTFSFIYFSASNAWEPIHWTL